jgi:hypothetical protein
MRRWLDARLDAVRENGDWLLRRKEAIEDGGQSTLLFER